MPESALLLRGTHKKQQDSEVTGPGAAHSGHQGPGVGPSDPWAWGKQGGAAVIQSSGQAGRQLGEWRPLGQTSHLT